MTSIRRMTPATITVERTAASATSEVIWARIRDLPLRSAVKPDSETDADSMEDSSLSNELVSDQSRVAAWKDTRVC